MVSVDKQAMTATVKGGTRLGVLARALEAQGLGLRNQPDVDVPNHCRRHFHWHPRHWRHLAGPA